MTTALVDRRRELQSLMSQAESRFLSLMGDATKTRQFAQILLTSVQKSPSLQKCTPMSIVGCALELGGLGLSPDQQLGQAYMVPYKDQAQLQIGYKGFIALAKRASNIIFHPPGVVREGDHFIHKRGMDQTLDHIESHEVRGEISHVYVVVEFADGRKLCESMNRDQVLKIKNRSPSSGSGPWVTDEEEMWKKTVIRRLAKYLDLSPELNKAVALDEQADAGVSQRNEMAVVDLLPSKLEQITPEPVKKAKRSAAPKMKTPSNQPKPDLETEARSADILDSFRDPMRGCRTVGELDEYYSALDPKPLTPSDFKALTEFAAVQKEYLS